MPGYTVYCGTFHGEEESASPIRGIFEGLLEFTPEQLDVPALPLVAAEFEDDPELVAVSAPDAEALLPLLEAYRSHLELQIGAVKEAKDAIQHDRAAGLDMVEAQRGAGLGWRYYALHDTILAFKTAAQTRKPVLFVAA